MDMKAILPSYIVRMLKKMFPGMNVLSYDDTAKEHSYIKIPKTELEWTDENLAKITCRWCGTQTLWKRTNRKCNIV